MPPWQEDAIMHALFRGISVIPVLTIERERDAVPLARALFEGGLPVIEITLRTAAAPAAIAAIIRELPQIVVGAGTLLRAADIATAVQAGARFLVSPGLTPELASAASSARDMSSSAHTGNSPGGNRSNTRDSPCTVRPARTVYRASSWAETADTPRTARRLRPRNNPRRRNRDTGRPGWDSSTSRHRPPTTSHSGRHARSAAIARRATPAVRAARNARYRRETRGAVQPACADEPDLAPPVS